MLPLSRVGHYPNRLVSKWAQVQPRHLPLEEPMKRQNSERSLLVMGLVGLMFSLLFAVVGLGQAGTSSVRGTVKDPQGNVVPGATVTLSSLGTNQSRTTTTSDSGTYVFDFVQVGDYRLEVEAKGFKKSQVPDVHALVARATSIDVQLEIGNVSETVTVASGTEALVNRDDG